MYYKMSRNAASLRVGFRPPLAGWRASSGMAERGGCTVTMTLPRVLVVFRAPPAPSPPLASNLWGQYYYYSHCKDEEI